nr:L,D-transpeptidase family protein [Vibrio sonorensis]
MALEHFVKLGWIAPESQVHELVQYPSMVKQLYIENDNQMIWLDLQQSSKLEFQLEIIQTAGFSPLFSRQLSYLQFYRKSNRWLEYDVLATDTLLLYLSYSYHAARDGKDWFFSDKLTQALPKPPKGVLLDTMVAIDTQYLGELIEDFTPTSADYQHLVNTYLHLLKYQKLDLPMFLPGKTLRVGQRMRERETLIQRLAIVDVDTSEVTPDINWYDVTLAGAVKEFQRIHGLKVDGVIGPSTLKWLNLSPEKRLVTLALNAERARIWPSQREALILVNVPSFEMRYWYSGEQQFSTKVVVGRKTRQTPVMTTKLDSLILNPTWNVPWKIMVEDIIPLVQKDPEYLVKNHIQIVTAWRNGEVVDPSVIDWQTLNPRAFPYKMRQLSGNGNALGLYKFNTPNRRAIYLHDTPSKHLFNKTTRAYSSGCIRVENADQFASLLLANQGMSFAKETSEPIEESNQAIPFKRRIPVHIIYQTAWFEDGLIHYRDDIYRYDRSSYIKG